MLIFVEAVDDASNLYYSGVRRRKFNSSGKGASYLELNAKNAGQCLDTQLLYGVLLLIIAISACILACL